jgi:hypothetical protein
MVQIAQVTAGARIRSNATLPRRFIGPFGIVPQHGPPSMPPELPLNALPRCQASRRTPGASLRGYPDCDVEDINWSCSLQVRVSDAT